MDTIQIVLTILAGVVLVITLMPLVRSDYWTFRIFDFPRLQKLTLGVSLMIAMLCAPSDNPVFRGVLVLLTVNCVYLVWIILPYTPFHKTWVKKARKVNEDNVLSLVVSNVYQENTNYAGCLKMLYSADPDLILLLETDAGWQKNMSAIEEKYPHRVLVPQDNTYGMLLYSRLPLRKTEVKFLVEEDIPSIFCQVQLKGKQWVQLYCLHPTPPSPTENLRSTERDQELLITADYASKQKLPVIVMGDLNDVAWSYTTELFLKMSGLLDPRIGRGFYNSFNAKIPIMRFPLDHLFVSNDFQHVAIKRLDNFNSDHFPIYGKYQYSPSVAKEQEPLTPTEEDVEIAEEKKNAT